MNLKRIDNNLEEEILAGMTDSGLRFILNPKPGFSKTMGIVGVRFGSTDDTFVDNETVVHVPEGTAHFLEHKLFEDQDGDVSDRFSSIGASCNAGTGFVTTSYLFSCANKVEENLKLLLSFVQNPYFTEDLISKEQGIIGQEIKMYNDDPDWIVFFNLMRCLYRDHPVKLNIAGTIESIAKIDTEVLNRCYRAYYRPGNMVLVLAGKMDPAVVSRIIEEDSGNRTPDKQRMLNDRKIVEKDLTPSQTLLKQQMVVARPKVLLGFKDHDLNGGGEEQQTREIMTQMVIEILFGKSSSSYEKLYKEGTIDDTFSAYYSGYLDFGFSILGLDTDTPNRFRDRIHDQLRETLKDGISPSDYERQKNKYLGKFIRTFNSIESSAYSLLNFTFKGLYPQKVMDIIEKITLDDLNTRLKRHLNPDEMVCSMVEPMGFDNSCTEE